MTLHFVGCSVTSRALEEVMKRVWQYGRCGVGVEHVLKVALE